MKKIIISLLFIISASLLSTAVYIHFSTKDTVDTMIESLKPVLTVTYRNFYNPFDGSIAIQGISVINNMTGNTFTINSIELKLASILDYIDLDKLIRRGEIPPKFQLKINYVHSNLEFLKSLEISSFGKVAAYIAALGCGDIKEITYKYLPKMGYESIDLSAVLDVVQDDLDTRNIHASVILHNIESYSLKTSIPNISELSEDLFSNIDSFEIEIENLGYNDRLIDFCSTKSKLDRNDYIKLHQQETKNYFTNAGLEISDEIYRAYSDYFSSQAIIRLVFQPKNILNLKNLHLYKIEIWPSLLGLSLYNDNKKVTNLHISTNKEIGIKSLLASRKLSLVKKSTKPTQINKKSKQNYIEIKKSDIYDYVNHQVKIQTKRGTIYQGTIKKITSYQVILESGTGRKKAEWPLSTHQISHIFIIKK